MKAVKKQIKIQYKEVSKATKVNTLEGIELAKAGDILLSDSYGSPYPISKSSFEKTYNKVDSKFAVKKPIKIEVTVIPDTLTLLTDWGSQHGVKGDYLAHNINDHNDKWIIKKDIFNKTYDIVND